MKTETWQAARGYAIAVATVVATCLVWGALTTVIGNRVASSFFLMAIVAVNRWAGQKPAWLALILGALPVTYSQFSRPGLNDLESTAIVAVYFVLGAVLNGVMQSQRTARQMAESKAAESLKKQQLLAEQITEREVVERELLQSQNHLQAILDHAANVIYLKDWEGRMRLVNKRFEELFHVTQAEVVGRHCEEFFPREFAAQFNAHNQQAREAGEPLTCEEIVPQDDGPHTYVSVRFPIFDAAGRGYATGCIATDVTELKRAEAVLREAEDRFRTLVAHAPIGIAQGDAEGSIFFVNSKWCELAGIAPEESLGFQWKNFIHPDDIENFIQVWQTALQAGNDLAPCEFRVLHRSGEIRWGSCSISLLKNPQGAVTGQIATVQDITDRKRDADALEVEREFLQHTIELKDREQHLTAYEIHDGIVQHATAALMHIQGALPQVQPPEVAAKIDVAVHLLRQAVAEGRRVMNGIRTPVLDDLGIIPAIEQLVAETPHEQATIEFVHDAPMRRLAAKIEDALFRITQEALTNARRHSGSERIRIEIGRRGDRVHLEIRDWGHGFRPPIAVKGVHGLKGMAERARIAGGQCVVKSEPGHGTQVLVDLPYLER